MKTIGIWLDKEKAYIITTGKEQEEIQTVFSEIETYHILGGSGTRFKGGPQDVVQDKKYLEREKNQFKAYFKKLLPYITDANKVALFGPAETAEKLYKDLKENHPILFKKVEEIKKVDSMTENQMKALVRDYFNK
ncbi:hypothetical protein [Aquimarina sp. 2201CG5-10]|uniref:hypothetical protein n=1 Tax=Aquimarina callyspongiae TaxID=3098150 RepID=UPI002AB5154B|nr:hypothetical protein [Aquimarina sp. 2201CG5-10]MDY8134908.1 hypothetical protein [Aquimarina sp. 2201CG5-10]